MIFIKNAIPEQLEDGQLIDNTGMKGSANKINLQAVHHHPKETAKTKESRIVTQDMGKVSNNRDWTT